MHHDKGAIGNPAVAGTTCGKDNSSGGSGDAIATDFYDDAFGLQFQHKLGERKTVEEATPRGIEVNDNVLYAVPPKKVGGFNKTREFSYHASCKEIITCFTRTYEIRIVGRSYRVRKGFNFEDLGKRSTNHQ